MNHRVDPGLDAPLDDDERVLMDSDTWDWDEVWPLLPSKTTGAVLAIHLSRDELTRIEQGARAEGTTLTEFVKQSALRCTLHRAQSEWSPC
jgi:hypothetical protein